MSVDLAEKKWYDKVSGKGAKWETNVKSSDAFDSYVKKIAAFLGVPEDKIRTSDPAKNWSAFQTKAAEYRSKFESGVRVAYETKKWSKRYKAAYGV